MADAPSGGVEDRRYQREAVKAIVEGLADGGRGQLEAACGTGKTLISIRAAGELVPGGGLIVVLTPSLALVSQTLLAWRERDEAGLSQALAVCSDDTVADAPAHLGDLTVPVTTDPATVASWVAGPGRRLIVGTYLSAPVVAEALGCTGRPADLLICDEAHHLAGRAEFATRRVLDGTWLPARRRLFMTATRRLASTYRGQVEMVTMDDETVFGPLLFRYPFADGIEDGHLKDYRLLVIGVTDRQGRQMLRDSGAAYVERAGAPDLRTVVAQAALGRARVMHGITRAITYHARVEHAAEFARTLPGALKRLPASHRPAQPPANGHVHGGMNHQQRETVLRHLRQPPPGGWSVVSNARCLGEGVDLPAVDAVMFAHPKRSAVDIVQAVGRALRRGGTTDTATVIVPVVVPDADGEIGDLDPGEYKTLWDVVRALRAHDEQLAEDLDWQRSHDTVENPQLPSKITIELPPQVTDRVLASLTLLLIRQTTSVWLEGYGAACAWHARHGHLDIPQDYVTPGGVRLGGWLSDQRGRQRRGLLPPDKVAALERLGIVWDSQRKTFDEWITVAAAYRAEHGHLRVPTKYLTPDGQRLGTWLSNQRTLQSGGTLPAHRVRQLEDLGIVWRSSGGRSFDSRLAALRAYRARHGTVEVPHSYTTPDGDRLGAWLASQRQLMRQGRISADREAALRRLGVTATSRHRPSEDWLRLARAYRDEHGHLNVPQDYLTPGGDRLGGWLSNQRSRFKRGTTPPELVRALDELGMLWDGSGWAVGLAAATAWHREHGHLTVPKDTVVDGVNLNGWLQDRRREHRAGTLSADQVQALDALGIVWEPFTRRWEAGYAAAAAWAGEHGHLTVPAGTVHHGIRLDRWLANRRRAHRCGDLAPQRAAALEALGIVWDPHEQDWRDGLADVGDFVQAHGHARIPRDARGTRIRALGVWLQRRRAEYRAGDLPADRAAALERLGVVWENAKIAAHEPYLEAARVYHAEHGHLRVPSTYRAGGIKLGRWLLARRQEHRTGRLRAQVAERLAAIDPDWTATDNT